MQAVKDEAKKTYVSVKSELSKAQADLKAATEDAAVKLAAADAKLAKAQADSQAI